MGRRKTGNEPPPSALSRILRVLYFTPLVIIFLERLWFPFESIGNVSSYFNVEITAISRESKTIESKSYPKLSVLTRDPSDWIACASGTEMIVNVNDNFTPSEGRKIPLVCRSAC